MGGACIWDRAKGEACWGNEPRRELACEEGVLKEEGEACGGVAKGERGTCIGGVTRGEVEACWTEEV